MSENTTDREQKSADRWSFKRRQVLQAAGVGIGGLALAGYTGEIVTAKTGCANGPFEGTYEAGTVNVGEIRADQATGTSPESIGAASPRKAGETGPGGEQPPRQNAQESNTGQDGPLTIQTEYDGVNAQETRGGVPSDSQIAVGGGKLLHALNRNIAIYNKQSGRREQFFRLERLWKPVIPEPEGGFADDVPFVFDPRARYDRKEDRFIVCATQFQAGVASDGTRIDRETVEEAAQENDEEKLTDASRPPRGWFLVAVSATDNPNGKWYVYRIPPENADSVNNIGLVDYPMLGFDRDAIYLTQNFFGTEIDMTMVALDKAAMYTGVAVTGYHFNGMNDSDSDGLTFTIQPTQQPFSGGQSGTYYLVNSDFPAVSLGFSETLTLWELTEPLDDPSLECFTLDVDPYSPPPSAHQPETDVRIDTLGNRLMNADVADGSLWTAHTIAFDWEDAGTPVAAIKWYEIDLSSREVVQSGVYGEPGKSYFLPTVGSHNDTTMIVHNVSGPETFARMDVATRTSAHTPGELEDSIIVEEGASKYVAIDGPIQRWGDYNGISVDPSSGRFWTVSQYSPDSNIPLEQDERDPYYTRIAEVFVDEN